MNKDKYSLPKGWVLTQFRAVCQINPKHPKDIVSDDTPVSFVPMSSIDAEQGEIIERQTNPFGKIRKGYTHFAEGDILFAKITPCMENGKVAIAKNLLNGIGCGTTELHVLRSIGSIPSELIYYYIRQDSFRKRAEANMSGTAGHLRVSVDFIKESEFPLPPSNEQKRIVTKIENLLGRLNKTKQELAKIPPLIKKFRQSVLAKAFSGELTREWREQQKNLEPASVFLDRIRTERKKQLGKKHKEPESIDTSDLLELPEGWEWIQLREVADILGGKRLPKKHNYSEAVTEFPYIRVTDFSEMSVGVQNLKYLKPETQKLISKYTISKDDLYISIAGSIGKVGLIPDQLEGANLTENAAKVSSIKDFDKKFLCYFLNSTFAQEQIERLKTFTNQPKLALFRIEQIKCPFLLLQEQMEIVKIIEKSFSQIDTIEKSVRIAQAHCEKLTQSILAKAFRGKLVSQEK